MRTKKLLGVLLALALVIGMIPMTTMTASAAMTAFEFVNTDDGIGLKATFGGAGEDMNVTVFDKTRLEAYEADAGDSYSYMGTPDVTATFDGGDFADAVLYNDQLVANSTGTDQTITVPGIGGAAHANKTLVAYAYDSTSGSTGAVKKEVTLDANGRVPVDQAKFTYYDGSTKLKEVSVDANETLNPATVTGVPTPAKTGYTLGGWAATNGGTTAVTSQNSGAKDNNTDFYAIWTPVQIEMSAISNVQNIEEGGSVNITAPTVTKGADGNTFALTAQAGSSVPAWLTVNTSTGAITGTVAAGEGGNTYSLTLTATNSNGTTASRNFTISVKAPGQPTADFDDQEVDYDGTNKALTVTNVKDGDGNAATATVTYTDKNGGAVANPKNAGEYTATVVVGGKTVGTAKLTIKPKTLTINFAGNEAGKTLDDVTSTLTGVVDGDTVTVSVTWTEVTGTKDVCDSENCTDTCTCHDPDNPVACTETGHNCQLGQPKTAADFPLTAGSSHAYTVALAGTDAANYTLADGTMTIAADTPSYSGGVSSDFTVTYAAGAHGTINGATSEKVKRNESPVNVPTVTANKGYAFIGWTADGKTLVNPAAQTITKNTTFTAVYGDHLNYMVGRSAMEFVPDGNLTRAEAAAILSRLTEGFEEDGTYPAAPYSDLAAGAWYVKYVNFAADKGIVNGRTDGTFDPDASITRAEFATMIANFAKIAPVDTAAVSTDVAGHWAEGYIAALEQAKIVTGYEDGTFRPNRTITRAEAATMVNGAIGRVPMSALDLSVNGYANPFVDVNASQWFYAQVMEATVDHVTAHFHQ